MANYDFDIGILGGGAAGLTIAAGAAQLGAKTLLIEKDNELGGDCLHFGCVPSKTLIKTAQVYHLMRHPERFGLPTTEVKPVDFQEVAKRIQSVIAAIQKHDSKERFCRLGARVEIGAANFIDNHTVRLNQKNYSSKTWVIATGSSPSIPPIKGLTETPYITNREMYSLEKLPGTMIILGAGPVAIEMAQAFSRLGTKVFVIQRSDQILTREDKDMAEQVMNVLKGEGVTFHLNTSIISLRDLGDEREVIIKGKEDSSLVLRGEVVLVAAGRDANLGGLGLKEIGVEFDKKGLKTDKRLRTSQPHIFAAGDVTGQYQFTHAAGYEGGIVISNAIFHLPRQVDYTFLPWCSYTDPELASIGMNEKAASTAGIKYSIWTEEFKDNDRSLAEGEQTGKIKMILDQKERPLGVQILGPRAGELISEWVAVMHGGMKLSRLASAVHPYPTLAEINKKVVGTFFSKKLFSEKVRKGLKFFFHLKGRDCGGNIPDGGNSILENP
jgi:pyruvate/2-oxoglutarate dehydrogenase complex dihydrolipoamide dehydrogenase (E3) component